MLFLANYGILCIILVSSFDCLAQGKKNGTFQHMRQKPVAQERIENST